MYYCCTVDVVNRRLPVAKKTRFPEERKRLLKLMVDDQQERLADTFFSHDIRVAQEVTKRERARIEEVLSILDRIKTPSVRNIGLDGSRAMWLIALHNFNYKNAGGVVLRKMQQLYYRNKEQVFYPGIPFLVDRIMVASKQPLNLSVKQRYGTQGLSIQLKDGTMQSQPFLVIDAEKLAERRRRFGLAPKSNCKHQVRLTK